MKLFFLEAFDGGSHAQFSKELLDYFPGEYFGLPARHWKWRLQGSHFQLAEWANDNIKEECLFFFTSLTDIASFRGLLKKNLRSSPIILYMHENQMEYPHNTLSPSHVTDLTLKKEVIPSFHLNQVLACDKLIFNSHYNLKTTFSHLRGFCKRRQEKSLFGRLERIERSSQVLPVGIQSPNQELKSFEERNIDFLWNHRWDYDKNPSSFQNLSLALIKEFPHLKIALLGEDSQKSDVFSQLKGHSQNIVKEGFLNNREEYWSTLTSSKILPVTSIHDFQGISLLEAMISGVIPLVPNRMVYPEILQELPQLIYNSQNELEEKCHHFITQDSPLRERVKEIATPFLWQNILPAWKKNINSFSS